MYLSLFSGVGYGQAIATSSVVSYYTCLIAMSVFYLIASCQSVLPWTVCDPEIVLNNTLCVGTGQNATQLLADAGNFNFLFILFFYFENFSFSNFSCMLLYPNIFLQFEF